MVWGPPIDRHMGHLLPPFAFFREREGLECVMCFAARGYRKVGKWEMGAREKKVIFMGRFKNIS